MAIIILTSRDVVTQYCGLLQEDPEAVCVKLNLIVKHTAII
jgi:hypothetical protein